MDEDDLEVSTNNEELLQVHFDLVHDDTYKLQSWTKILGTQGKITHSLASIQGKAYIWLRCFQNMIIRPPFPPYNVAVGT